MNLKNKKKVTHLIYSGLGGASKVGVEILKNFSKNKKINNSVIFNGVEDLFSDYRSIVKRLKIKYFFFKLTGRDFLKNLNSILFKLNKIKPNVIITHEIGLLSILIYKLFNKTKVISVIHSPFQNFKQVVPLLLILAISNKIVFVTKKKDISYKFFNFLTSRTTIIENGISLYKINKKISRSKRFIIGKSIRFVNQKKPELLIDICNLYKEILLKNKISFTIAGIGPNFQDFQRSIKKNKLQKLIKLEGYLSEKKLLNWYKKLNLFINLSSDENLSISILEAMSIPLPILVSRLDANLVICKKKFYGHMPFLTTENDSKLIFRKIMYLYRNKNLCKKISKSAYKNVKLFYTSKRMSEQYFKLI